MKRSTYWRIVGWLGTAIAAVLALGALIREGDWKEAGAWMLVALWMSDFALTRRYVGGDA